MWLSWLRALNKRAHSRVTFPNHSRSYDAIERGVRFWGYDQSMEASFLMTTEAFRCVAPGVQPQEAADLLRVFDTNRDHICAIAAKVYSRDGTDFCKLMAADFS